MKVPLIFTHYAKGARTFHALSEAQANAILRIAYRNRFDVTLRDWGGQYPAKLYGASPAAVEKAAVGMGQIVIRYYDTV